MGKDEFISFLAGRGYHVTKENSCVMVIVPEISKKVQREIRALVKDTGYQGSYGWRIANYEPLQ